MRRLSVLLLPATVTALVAAVTTGAAAAGPAGANADRFPATASRTVRLLTGDAVTLVGTGARPQIAYRPAHRGGVSGSSTVLHLGGATYVVPGSARRYLGTVLDKSLFDVDALRRAPARLPVAVSLSSTAARPTAPGLVITSRSGTSAAGYLDPSRAVAFGDALAAQAERDAAAHRVSTSVLGGISHLAVPGSATVGPNFAQVTLIVKAIDAQGRPAAGVTVGLINVDDAAKYTGLTYLPSGQSNVSVPKGHYSLFAQFDDFTGTDFVTRLVPIPDVTVTTNRQVVTVDARRATVRPAVRTPRPASVDELDVEWSRTAGAGGFQFGVGTDDPSHLFVAPTRTSPYGTTDWVTRWALSAAPASGTAYHYDLAFHDAGAVPADQSHSVTSGQLATVNTRFFADTTTLLPGAFGRSAVFPFESVVFTTLATVGVPSARTDYLLAPSSAAWTGVYQSPAEGPDPFGGTFVLDGAHRYPAGSTSSGSWLNGTLTPGLPVPQDGDTSSLCYACRGAKDLVVALLPTTDSDPGHFGFPTADVRFRVWRNGTSLFDQVGYYGADLAVPMDASTYRVREDVARAQDGARLATQVSTDVTFRSAAGQGPLLPGNDFCDFGDGCRVLPLLTVRVPLPTDLSGTVARGPATIRFTVDHAPGAARPAIGTVTFQYAVGGGAWKSVPTSALGAHRYRAVVAAPPGSRVSVRVTATDAAGGRIVSTSTDAYRVATS